MSNPIEQQIQRRMIEFVDDLTGLVRAQVAEAMQEAVRRALLTAPGVGRHGKAPVPSPGRRGPGTGQKRRPGEVDAMAQRLLGEIRKRSGRRIEQIAAAMKLPTDVLALPIQRLVTAKKIRTTGTRRGTKYFVR